MNEEEITAILQQKEAELEAAKGQVEDLNAQLGERDASLGKLQAQLAEKAALVEDKERELVTLREVSEVAQGEIATLSESLQEAITKYRGIVVAANPDVPGDMITGESIADIDASLETSMALVEKVASSLQRQREEEAKATSIPAGAPERSGPDISSLSPREKIEHALRKETE